MFKMTRVSSTGGSEHTLHSHYRSKKATEEEQLTNRGLRGFISQPMLLKFSLSTVSAQGNYSTVEVWERFNNRSVSGHKLRSPA